MTTDNDEKKNRGHYMQMQRIDYTGMVLFAWNVVNASVISIVFDSSAEI